jgi:hypothetical protein
VRNHEITDVWSGPEGQATAVSFGNTSAQFCAFLAVHPQDNAGLYVLNPHSLGISEEYQVLAIVPFGYPAQQLGRGRKQRKPIEELVSRERFA